MVAPNWLEYEIEGVKTLLQALAATDALQSVV